MALSSLPVVAASSTPTEAELKKVWKENYEYGTGSFAFRDGWVYQRDYNLKTHKYDELTGEIVGYYGAESEIVIPSVVDGEETYACELWISDYVKKLTIPKGFNLREDVETNPIMAKSLEAIEVEKGHELYTSVDGVLYSKQTITDSKDKKVIYKSDVAIAEKYPSAKKDESFVLPAETREIAHGFINSNPYLKTLTIQETVDEVGVDALDIPNLEKLYFKNNTIKLGYFYAVLGAEYSRTAGLNAPKATVYCHKNSAAEKWLKGEFKQDELGLPYISAVKYKEIKYLESPKTPKKPVIKSKSYTEKGIKLTVKDYSAKGVKVYRKSGKKYKYIGYTSGKTFYDTTAKAGKTYSYKLRAYNKKNGATANSKYSEVVKVAAKPKTPKATAIKSTSYKKGKGVKITVNAYNAKGIKVYRKSGKKYKYVGYTSSKTFYDKTAKKGKTYTYKVRTYNKINGVTANSKYSKTKTFKVK